MERDRVKKYGGLPRKSNNMLERDEETTREKNYAIIAVPGTVPGGTYFFSSRISTKHTKTAQATSY